MTLAEVFIPEDRRRALATGKTLPERTYGAVLFADISGFTPLTEALGRTLGPRRGAEVLTELLNRVYTALIDAVEHWGGSVIGFSGDAIACWFAADGEAQAGPYAAAGCAFAMQEAMTAFAASTVATRVEAKLALKTALVTGEVHRLVVGDPAIQSIDVLAGAVLDTLADVEHAAREGEVVADSATVAILAARVQIREDRLTQEGRVVTILAAAKPDWVPPLQLEDALHVSDAWAKTWVLPAVHERLRTEEGRFLAELRPATAMFLQFTGLDFEQGAQAGRVLNAFVCWVQRVVNRYEGALIQLTTGDKGSYLYAAFGATITHDDDTLRAVAAALELRNPPAELVGIRDIRIGISHGLMRVGPYGSATRLTYGVLGDATNLAARLMTQAQPGAIWLSEQSAELAAVRFELEPLGTRLFKGKASPQPVFVVSGPRLHPKLPISAVGNALLVGRQGELAEIAAAARAAHTGHGSVIRIEGEAGAGKSHLVAHFVHDVAHHMVVLYAACQSTAQNTAYFAARQFVRPLLGLDDAIAQPKDSQIAALEATLRDRDPAWLLRLPLLGELLGLPIQDNPTTAAFDTRMRQEALAALVVEIISKAAQEHPFVLIIEDAYWLDEASRGLVLAMARIVPLAKIMLMLVQRPLGIEQEVLARELADLPAQRRIVLAELDRAGTAQMVAGRLQGAIEPLALDIVHTLAQGNPFFTEELVDALHEGELIAIDEGRWQLAGGLVDSLRRANCLVRDDEAWRLAENAPLSAVQVGVPSSIHGLVLSRLDRLPEIAKLTLKVASVIGRVFELDLLAAAHPSSPHAEVLADQFRLFQSRDFARLETPEPRPTYIFKHNITQEVVYQTLLETQRQELHLAVAEALEARDPAAIERLAHHYTHANLAMPRVRTKAIDFVEASAHRAQHEHANETALVYFDRALQLEHRWEWLKGRVEALHVLGRRMQEEATLVAMEQLEHDSPERKLQGVLLWAKFHASTGDYEEATRWADDAYDLAVGLNDRRNQALCHNQRGLIAWRQGNYAAATAAYNAALALALAGDAPALVDVASEARYGLGLVYRQQSHYDAARLQFEEDLTVNRRLGNRQNEARAINALGSIANLEREYSAAVELFRQALHIREMIGDRAGVGTSVLSLAQAFGNMGDYSQVEPLLQKALTIQEAIHNPWEEMLILNELGILFTAVGVYIQAFTYLERALQRSRTIGSEIGTAYILCNLGQAQRDAGLLAEGVTTLEQGLALARAQEDINLAAIYLSDLALTNLRTGNLATAITQAQRSLEIYAELDQPMSTTVVLATIATAQLGLGELQQAEQVVHDALRILDECGGEGPDYPHRDYWMCSLVLEALGRTDEAINARRRAGELLVLRAERISDKAMRESFLKKGFGKSGVGIREPKAGR